ncbi:Myosin-2 [Verticillium dahliae VDG1]|nr:Myosin-2 [Verticillium dahliae VDG1]
MEFTISKSVAEEPSELSTKLSAGRKSATTTNKFIGLLLILSVFGVCREILTQYFPREAMRNLDTTYTASRKTALDDFVTPETAQALENDIKLRRSILAMVDFTADMSNILATRYASPELHEATEVLQAYRSKMLRSIPESEASAIEKRQLPSLGNLIGGGGDATPGAGGLMDGLGKLVSGGLSNIGSSLAADASGAGLFLGIGVGAGAAQGLNISTAERTTQIAAKVASDNKMEATGLNPTIQNLGVGLTSSLLGAVNVSSLASGIDVQSLVMSLAQGLGNGTVAGLNLNPAAPMLMVSNETSIANIAGTLGFGLTQSVTSNIDTKAIIGSLNNPNNTAAIMKNLPDAAAGIGRGLGEGAAVGLGLQASMPVAMRQMPDGAIDILGVSQTFTKELTASFLQNGTASKLAGMLGGSMDMQPPANNAGGIPSTISINGQSVEISRVAQGFASGLLQGGAAAGLGAGIGGQGVLLVSMLIANPTGTPADPSVNVDTSKGFNLSVIINAQTVSSAAQGGIDALTCQGVGGGLGNILLGLLRSKTISTGSLNNDNTTKTIRQVIPTGIIKIKNEGNTYNIDGGVIRESFGNNILGAVNGIEINGMKLAAWIAFIVIHILFAIVAFVNVLPIALGLESVRNLLHKANLPHILPKIPKWNNIMWLFVIAPSILIVFVFGVIISLITTLVGIGAVALHIFVKVISPPQSIRDHLPQGLFSLPNVRGIVNQLFLFLAVASAMTGSADLSSVALCLTQIIPFDIALSVGFGLSTPFALGSSIIGLEAYLSFREARMKKKALKNGSKNKEEVVIVKLASDGSEMI